MPVFGRHAALVLDQGSSLGADRHVTHPFLIYQTSIAGASLLHFLCDVGPLKIDPTLPAAVTDRLQIGRPIRGLFA